MSYSKKPMQPILPEDVQILTETKTVYRAEGADRFFYNEKMARWDASTHARCDCGELCSKFYTCDKCREIKAQERWQQAEAKLWDGSLIYSDALDKYFEDPEAAIDWIIENLEEEYGDINVDENPEALIEWVNFQMADSVYESRDFGKLAAYLRAYQCEPKYLPTIEPWTDLELPDDYELSDVIPGDIQLLLDELNKIIENRKIIVSYSATKIRSVF